MSTPGRPPSTGADTPAKPAKMDVTYPLRERINRIKAARRLELGRYVNTVETLEHIVAEYEANHAAD